MPSIVTCPECGKKLSVADRLAASNVRCPKCRAVFSSHPGDVESDEILPAEETVPADELNEEGIAEPQNLPSRLPPRRRPKTRSRSDADDEHTPVVRNRAGRLIAWSCVALLVMLGGGAFVVATWFPQHWPLALAPEAPAVRKAVVQKNNVVPLKGPWIQDFAKAKQRATNEKKDILVSFEGSDWCIWCQRMDKEVFSRPDFLEQAQRDFVLVKIDFPQDPPAQAQVENATRNQALSKHFNVPGYPFVVLTDSTGVRYGTVDGFVEGGSTVFLQGLQNLQNVRVRRDQLLARMAEAKGPDALQAARQALLFLKQCNLQENESEVALQGLQLARKLDGDNQAGHLEFFFTADWMRRFRTAPTPQLGPILTEMEQWKQKHGEFKDIENAAYVCLELARGKAELEQYEAGMAYLDKGRKLNPRNPLTRQGLAAGPAILGLSTGTAFAVSDNGHFLTNANFVGGPGKIFLRPAGQDKIYQADILVEQRDRDLALLQIKNNQPKTTTRPLPIPAANPARRGQPTCICGYPLGASMGRGLKLTTGVISALPEAENESKLVLDVLVNPGSNGSPLCDDNGNLLGIVSARTDIPPGVAIQNVFGMAVPVADIASFLKEHLPGFQPAKLQSTKSDWEDIDRQISPSVALVLKARPRPKLPAAP